MKTSITAAISATNSYSTNETNGTNYINCMKGYELYDLPEPLIGLAYEKFFVFPIAIGIVLIVFSNLH